MNIFSLHAWGGWGWNAKISTLRGVAFKAENQTLLNFSEKLVIGKMALLLVALFCLFTGTAYSLNNGKFLL